MEKKIQWWFISLYIGNFNVSSFSADITIKHTDPISVCLLQSGASFILFLFVCFSREKNKRKKEKKKIKKKRKKEKGRRLRQSRACGGAAFAPYVFSLLSVRQELRFLLWGIAPVWGQPLLYFAPFAHLVSALFADAPRFALRWSRKSQLRRGVGSAWFRAVSQGLPSSLFCPTSDQL